MSETAKPTRREVIRTRFPDLAEVIEARVAEDNDPLVLDVEAEPDFVDRLIIRSFYWSTTREGHDYWSAIHSEDQRRGKARTP